MKYFSQCEIYSRDSFILSETIPYWSLATPISFSRKCNYTGEQLLLKIDIWENYYREPLFYRGAIDNRGWHSADSTFNKMIERHRGINENNIVQQDVGKILYLWFGCSAESTNIYGELQASPFNSPFNCSDRVKCRITSKIIPD